MQVAHGKYYQRIATGIEELVHLFVLIFRTHPFVGSHFVDKGINIMSFEMVRTKNLFCQNVFTQIITSNNKYCYGIYYSATFVQLY